MTSLELHPMIISLAPILGVWRGRGEGHYPTIDDFSYLEELTFGHVGKPFVAMAQKTRDASTELPLHAESGYFRPQDDGTVELVLAQPSGILEVLVGPINSTDDGVQLDLASVSVHLSPSAKSVTGTRRRYVVSGHSMVFDMWMAAVGEPLTHHLSARLDRVGGQSSGAA